MKNSIKIEKGKLKLHQSKLQQKQKCTRNISLIKAESIKGVTRPYKKLSRVIDIKESFKS